MGSLIPIGGGADGEIQSLLNTAFNASNIRIIRAKIAKENLLDDHHQLHRIAYRLGTYPIGNYGADDAKGKWFYLLKRILKTARHNNESTATSIKKILAYAMSHTSKPGQVTRVVFRAIKGTDPNADHFIASGEAIAPGNPTADADIAALVDTTGTLSVVLVCPEPLPDQSTSVPNQTSDVDKDPQGNIIEKPPIKIFTPQDLSPPSLSPETRKPRKSGTPGRGKTRKAPAKKRKAAKTAKKAKKAKKR